MFSAIKAFTGIQRYIAGGLAIALALSLGWGFRINSIRADLRDWQATVTASASTAKGATVKNADVALFITQLAADRDRQKQDAALKKAALTNQSNSLNNLREQDEIRSKQSAEAVLRALDVIRSRDAWIAKANEAGARITPLTDSEELAQCKGAMDALYQAGF